MSRSRKTLVISVFALAAAASLFTARSAVQRVEDHSEIEIRQTLDRNDLTWAEVEADGLRVLIAGTAPTEALRFRALSIAGSVVDAERVIDEIEVAAVEELDAPRFSAELLRNTSGISIIGLIPLSSDRDAILEGFSRLDGVPVADLLETADYPAPGGWEDALAYAINSIVDLPRAKVSVEADRVVITAIADNPENKVQMEDGLRRNAPPSLQLTLDITAPRPVISPFTLRFVKDESGARFDTCSADTVDTQARILEAASRAGLTGTGRCVVGMGVPTPKWADAAEHAIEALSEIGYGTVTFSDADVTLAAAEGTDAGLFERVIGELENSLPDVFVLTARLPTVEEKEEGPVDFVATLSPEGQVQLRGRVGGEEMREIADSFAKSKFGFERVYTAVRVVPEVPGDWTSRVLTGIEALSIMNNGAVTVTADLVSLSGRSGDPEAGEKAARLMVEKLGDDAGFEIDVTYLEALDPVAALPTPDECEAQIEEIGSARKITFEPGSATIDESALGTMDDIAEVLQQCGSLRLEVQGHTDSQGREEMNLSLSQARAESVLNELRARKVLTSSFVAKGYGEAQPIAENDTEEGREENRRIEFRLIVPEPSVPEGDSALESIAETSDIQSNGE